VVGGFVSRWVRKPTPALWPLVVLLGPTRWDIILIKSGVTAWDGTHVHRLAGIERRDLSGTFELVVKPHPGAPGAQEMHKRTLTVSLVSGAKSAFAISPGAGAVLPSSSSVCGGTIAHSSPGGPDFPRARKSVDAVHADTTAMQADNDPMTARRADGVLVRMNALGDTAELPGVVWPHTSCCVHGGPGTNCRNRPRPRPSARGGTAIARCHGSGRCA
jgi:hypothetical protein